ncbi:MAG: DNA-binding response regulator [Anaerolineaceae bacterium 4572_78]|nr:MAG: DNA-binding response regulator [Anaerolineaceae bacterium 4572_78]
MSERILIVEDEEFIAKALERRLRHEGFKTTIAYNGRTALVQIYNNSPSLVLLDLTLPDIDGIEVTRELRQNDIDVPIIMLTARDAIPDRVKGLDIGADDYIVKPYNNDELMAHIRALLRRALSIKTEEPYQFADLTLEPASRLAYRGKRLIKFTAKEYDLLELFMRHPNQVLTRDQIFDNVWDYDFGGESNIIEVYIRYLRAKIEKEHEPRLIQTVRGVGYVLRE